MTPAELLAELNRLGVVVELGEDGRPVLDGAFTDEMLDAARDARWLFLWGLQGSTSGHSWHVCDSCGEVQLLARQRPCGMRDGCRGRMAPAPGPMFRARFPAGRHAS